MPKCQRREYPRTTIGVALAVVVLVASVLAGQQRASADHDVEHRIAQFWARIDAMQPGDYLSARDLGQWALNVIERDPRARLTVAEFRASTAMMQAGIERAGPAPVAAATPAPSAPPAPGARTFGAGMHAVGSTVLAGTYRTRTAMSGCYWERLSGASGQSSDIKANEFTNSTTIVTIATSDAYFKSQGCATWTSDLSAITAAPPAPFVDGHYIVGTDVGAGTWRSSSTSGTCYWERQSGFSGESSGIIANGLAQGPTFVTIAAGDRGFKSSGCGTWTKG